MKTSIKLGLSLLSIVFFYSPFAATSNWEINDIFKFKRIGIVASSPDANTTIFTILDIINTKVGKKWQYSLYLKNEQNQPKLLFKKDDSITSLAWNIDGKRITFLAKDKGKQTVWIASIAGQQPYPLFHFKENVESYKWSKDDKYILFTATNTNTPSKILAPQVVDQEKQNSQLYFYSLESKKIQALTTSEISISGGYDISPNGKFIAFSYQSSPGVFDALKSKIAILDTVTHEVKQIPYFEEFAGNEPLYSPDGKWIAFQSSLGLGKKTGTLQNNIIINHKICLIDTNTLTTKCLVNTFNQAPQLMGWNEKGTGVIVLDADAHQFLSPIIYEINLADNIPPKVISKINPNGFIEPLTITLNNKGTILGFGYEEINKAPQAYIASVNSFQLKKISQLSQNEKKFGNVKSFEWHSTDGKVIEGLLITPVNYDAKKKYPLFVNIHGGPAGIWGKRYLGGCDEYAEWIDPTTCLGSMLNLGFVIFQPNPRGSTGFGLDFRLANFADLGGGDFQDIMSGIDYLVQQNIADPEHLAIGGWSFGGYMTAWSISQTNRFKAAIDGDGNTDFISFTGTSDAPNYYRDYLGSYFWNNNQLYLQRAPIMHVKNIQTPLLILHGANDNRVPIGQAYELYTALKLQNKPVEFLIFPDQEHDPNDPNIIAESINIINLWLKKAL